VRETAKNNDTPKSVDSQEENILVLFLIFQARLSISIWNEAFIGKIPKTPFQEEKEEGLFR